MRDKIFQEMSFEDYILERLEQDNGYLVRTNDDFDRAFALDRDLLFKFLEDTQPKEMQALRKIFGGDLEETLIRRINEDATNSSIGLINILKSGIDIMNHHLDFMYTKPATKFNEDLVRKYDQNILSVMKEVVPNDKERVDVVIFLNGFPIIAIELKNELSGQNVYDAIKQYRNDRDPKSRLFRFKAGTLVNFAMDTREVYMTTKLDKKNTSFLAFNKGNGEGIHQGAGNPVVEGEISTAYMWEDILTKDTLLDILGNFIYLDRKREIDPNTGKKKLKETMIFPRYHQLDVVRKLLKDVYNNGSTLNYLIQHSTGSGKTNSITWLAHNLVSQHDEEDKPVFDKVIIITDRVVVDRQLQRAIQSIDHKDGLIKNMDDSCTSSDLAKALNGNTKIIATTIQKFRYIIDELKKIKNKKYAVIIDEAHSSTSGKNMAAVTSGLGETEEEDADIYDMISTDMASRGKQDNVSMFAFTATPKPTTLAQFGRPNKEGKTVPFHIYSMKQAIEEGYILDILENYTTYDTFYQLTKAIEEDPKYQTNEARRKIARFIKLHDTNIAQRIEIIVEHFRENVMSDLEGKAKAMVITSSREEAVKYQLAFERYIKEKGYDDIKALIAFSGKVKLDEDEREYTETLMNGIREDQLPDTFDQDEYKLLLVNNKYQTGFDQPKLSAMYVLKKLKGISAVQTLSRLNRTYKPYDKKTYVLDFVNSYDDIIKSFEPFYETTVLANNINPSDIFELITGMDSFTLLDQDDIDTFNELFYEKREEGINKLTVKMENLLQKAKDNFNSHTDDDKREILHYVRSYIRFYEFLLQASSLDDPSLHKRYNFLRFLLPMLTIESSTQGFDLKKKIKALGFKQRVHEEIKESKLKKSTTTKLPSADIYSPKDDKKEKLSEIIKDINNKMGTNFDEDFTSQSILQIRDLMTSSDTIKSMAKNNTLQEFDRIFDEEARNIITKAYFDNVSLYDLLLKNEEIRKEIFELYKAEIYKESRER